MVADSGCLSMQMDVMLTGASWPAPTSVSCLLVPALLKLMQHPAVDVRKQAIAVLNMMLQSMPAGLSDAIETYARVRRGAAPA